MRKLAWLALVVLAAALLVGLSTSGRHQQLTAGAAQTAADSAGPFRLSLDGATTSTAQPAADALEGAVTGTLGIASLVPPSPLEQATLKAINALRAQHKLRRLKYQPQLRAAAHAHDADMAAHGFFDHRSYKGGPSSWWQRISRYYPEGHFSNWVAGENLIWSAGALTPKQIIDAWLASPKHRAILLDPSWREVGVAAVVQKAPGVYGEYPQVMIMDADFGARY